MKEKTGLIMLTKQEIGVIDELGKLLARTYEQVIAQKEERIAFLEKKIARLEQQIENGSMESSWFNEGGKPWSV